MSLVSDVLFSICATDGDVFLHSIRHIGAYYDEYYLKLRKAWALLTH